VLAAGVNPGEAAIRSGALHDRFPATFPSGEGSDLAGVVSALGPGASLFNQGDEVLGWTGDRASHAEYVVVPETQLISKPARLSWEAAGSLYVVGATAYAAVEAVDPKEADIVAVSAAAGGVGSLAVQLLRLKGASVLAIASKDNHAWLAGKGVIPVAYGPELRRDLEAAAPGGVDAFIDLFGPEYVQLAIDLGVSPERIDTITMAGDVGVKTEGSAAATSAEVLAHVADLVASGQVEFPIAATFSLDEVQKAFELVERRHTHGKIVLIP
jgi:NADPH:quinone reductase-like Zn-dependent oxidoreductase